MKIGVFTPTFNRPDCARNLVLQMAQQQLQPNVLAIHQNGSPHSYEWAVADLRTAFPIRWLHTPTKIPQDQWYSVPLAQLLDEQCTHFFWCDHDDIYLSHHLDHGMRQLADGADFAVNSHCGLLKLAANRYDFTANTRFTSHAPGGMSSSMCFNRPFALQLMQDLSENRGAHNYSDEVVRHITMPRFNAVVADTSPEPSTIYVSHRASLTSSSWPMDEVPPISEFQRPLLDKPWSAVELDTRLMAHIGHVGDVSSVGAPAIHGQGDSRLGIQGLSIAAPGDGIGYQVRLADGQWTDWHTGANFAGTRNRSASLTGVAVCLSDALRAHWTLTLVADFARERSLRWAGDGEPCVARNPGGALLGLQLVMREV